MADLTRLALPAALATCGYLAARLADTRRRLDAAERRHTEVMGTLEEKRSSLERKIEELRTFEREYRTRLNAGEEVLEGGQLPTARGHEVDAGRVAAGHPAALVPCHHRPPQPVADGCVGVPDGNRGLEVGEHHDVAAGRTSGAAANVFRARGRRRCPISTK